MSRKQNCCIFGLSLFCPSLSRLQSIEETREEDGSSWYQRQEMTAYLLEVILLDG